MWQQVPEEGKYQRQVNSAEITEGCIGEVLQGEENSSSRSQIAHYWQLLNRRKGPLVLAD